MNSGLTGSLAAGVLRTNSFRRVGKSAKFNDQATWSNNLGAINHIAGPRDQVFSIIATNPSQLPIGVAGNSLTITASNAIAGGVTAGAVAGGAIGLTAGNAARLTSGNANGGAITAVGGNAIGSGTGGAITLTGGRGFLGGTVTITGGPADTTVTSSVAGSVVIAGADTNTNTNQPGNVTIKGGLANYNGFNQQQGGSVTIFAQGGSLSTGTIGGTGGSVSLACGSGGSNSASGGTGGNAGNWTVTGAAGGAVTGTSGTVTAGNGSNFSITSGAGGAATSASGTRIGGAGGAITFTTGNGGAGSTTNGNSGSFTISTGAAGAGAGSAGTIGSIIFRPGGTTKLTVDSTGVILADATAYAVLCGGTSTTTPLQSVVSVGTAGQVLTSNGAGALPTFETPSSTFTSPVIFPAFTIAAGASQIPAAASWPYGRCFVTDSNQTLTVGIGTNVAGGGTDKVPVWSDGSNWIIG